MISLFNLIDTRRQKSDILGSKCKGHKNNTMHNVRHAQGRRPKVECNREDTSRANITRGQLCAWHWSESISTTARPPRRYDKLAHTNRMAPSRAMDRCWNQLMGNLHLPHCPQLKTQIEKQRPGMRNVSIPSKGALEQHEDRQNRGWEEAYCHVTHANFRLGHTHQMLSIQIVPFWGSQAMKKLLLLGPGTVVARNEHTTAEVTQTTSERH